MNQKTSSKCAVTVSTGHFSIDFPNDLMFNHHWSWNHNGINFKWNKKQQGLIAIFGDVPTISGIQCLIIKLILNFTFRPCLLTGQKSSRQWFLQPSIPPHHYPAACSNYHQWIRLIWVKNDIDFGPSEMAVESIKQIKRP